MEGSRDVHDVDGDVVEREEPMRSYTSMGAIQRPGGLNEGASFPDMNTARPARRRRI
jgi:hypothetical protein